MSAVRLAPNLAVGRNRYVLKDTLGIDWICSTELVFESCLLKLSQKVGQTGTRLADVVMVFKQDFHFGVLRSAQIRLRAWTPLRSLYGF